MDKHLLFISINREHKIRQFNDKPDHNAFVDAVYDAKDLLLEAAQDDTELYDLISNMSFNKTVSLSHAKYTDDTSERLAITVDYEQLTIYIRYTNTSTQLDITNHVIKP